MARRAKRVKHRASEMINEEDRISSLPDGVIDHIYSSIDSRSSVQSSLLSRRWRNTWKSHSRLNYEISRSTIQSNGFGYINFVHKFLSARDDIAELSTIDFRSTSISLPLLKEIVLYAMSHRTQKLNIEFLVSKQTRRGGFDSSSFRSKSLQHLCLSIDFELIVSLPLTWDFPALTTLNLERVTIRIQLPDDSANKSVDLFSGFPNLKTLVLVRCFFWCTDIDTFIIMSSKLENLSLKGLHHSCEFVISAPKLSSFTYYGLPWFPLITKDLLSLKSVNFQTVYHKSLKKEPEILESMINTFVHLSKAECLTVNLAVFRFLLEFPKILKRRSCPFMNLQHLTLVLHRIPHSSTPVFARIVNYFHSSSPSLGFKLDIDPTKPITRYRFW